MSQLPTTWLPKLLWAIVLKALGFPTSVVSCWPGALAAVEEIAEVAVVRRCRLVAADDAQDAALAEPKLGP